MKPSLLVVVVLLSCAKPPTPEVAAPAPVAAAPEAAAPADPMAPRPFTVDQLRGAMPVGTKIRYRIEVQGQPPVEERWEVTAATETDCTIVSKVHDAATGAMIEDQGPATTAWAELVDHAAFPAVLTTIADGTITVPAGTFPTRRYTVEDLDGTIRVFEFAPSLPGPPVLLTATRDGAALMTMTLLERS